MILYMMRNPDVMNRFNLFMRAWFDWFGLGCVFERDSIWCKETGVCWATHRDHMETMVRSTSPSERCLMVVRLNFGKYPLFDLVHFLCLGDLILWSERLRPCENFWKPQLVEASITFQRTLSTSDVWEVLLHPWNHRVVLSDSFNSCLPCFWCDEHGMLFSDSIVCWQEMKRTCSIAMTKCAKCLPCEAFEKEGAGINMVNSSFLIFWESTISTLPVPSRALWSENCSSSLTSRLIQEDVLLSTWNARARRCIGTKEMIFSCLAGVVARRISYNLFTSFELPRMRLLVSSIKFCSDCCMNGRMELSTFTISCVLRRSCILVFRRNF